MMNPMPEGTDILIDEIGEEKNIGVLTAWTEQMEDEIWINAKTSNSIEFQLQHGDRTGTCLGMDMTISAYYFGIFKNYYAPILKSTTDIY